METTEWLQRTAGLLIEAQIRRLFQGLEEHRVCDLRIFFLQPLAAVMGAALHRHTV
jgi:hypothetical protein